MQSLQGRASWHSAAQGRGAPPARRVSPGATSKPLPWHCRAVVPDVKVVSNLGWAARSPSEKEHPAWRRKHLDVLALVRGSAHAGKVRETRGRAPGGSGSGKAQGGRRSREAPASQRHRLSACGSCCPPRQAWGGLGEAGRICFSPSEPVIPTPPPHPRPRDRPLGGQATQETGSGS